MNEMSNSNPKKESEISAITTYQAGILQSSAHRLLQKYSDEVLRPYGITKMQWMITGSVLDAGKDGIRITDLAKMLDTTLSYLTNTINLLESKGILQRTTNSQDERVKFVTVNPRFIPKCREIEKDLRAHLREVIYKDIAPEEFQTYMQVLHKLSRIQE